MSHPRRDLVIIREELVEKAALVLDVHAGLAGAQILHVMRRRVHVIGRRHLADRVGRMGMDMRPVAARTVRGVAIIGGRRRGRAQRTGDDEKMNGAHGILQLRVEGRIAGG